MVQNFIFCVIIIMIIFETLLLFLNLIIKLCYYVKDETSFKKWLAG